LARTTDARRLVDAKGYPGFDAQEDIPDATERAEKGATLTTYELLHIASMLRSVKSCLDYAHADRTFTTVLDEVFDRLIPNPTLEKHISNAILSQDLISDDASPALADIRRNIRLERARIKETLLSYVTGSRQRALQENIVTMRDGRYVVPVKQEYRGEVKGIIHDTSSSGATVFIEPMAVVDANNELRSLELREEREIERILAALSAECADFGGSLRLDYQNLTELSFIFACATLSSEMDAVEPELAEGQVIDLRRARHPLIDRARVVPVSVSLGREYDTLIITGPNTGGKTVTLKTMGLFAAMTQSGLHIPAEAGSTIGVFDAILVDIGDEQSIEQSLSTFSSHMVNVVGILQDVTDRSLALFDELGAGTDPIEGAALAVSILEQTRKAGALSAATTHYTELKMYALDTPGVMNAGCEFDVETLRPTYRLILGTPGKSNAFAISEKLGIPEEVVTRAKGLVAEDNRRFETVLEQLETTRTEMERAKEETEQMRRDYEIFKRESEIKLRSRTAEAEKSIQRDREKARQLLDSARINSEFVFKQLDELRKKQNSRDLAQELERTRRAVREQLKAGEQTWENTTFEDKTGEEPYRLPRPLKVGDRIYLVSYHAEGEVTAPPNGKQVEVKAGVFRGKVPLTDVRLLEDVKQNRKEPTKPRSEATVSRSGVANFKVELDVRGRYGDDAWFEVDRYLDEAVLAGVETVRIIHGKGTGALRVALHRELKADPRVKSFRLGNVGEGDSGVTVVTLK
jgi:DNA mismatch repair protein MutS2